jgi:hypothetical protein
LIDITLPDGYTLDELPDPAELKTAATSYNSKAEMNGNVLHYVRRYEINDVRVPLEHLKELRQFYRQLTADERSIAVFRKTSTNASSGRE